MRRLAIIDPEHGHQPLTSEDETTIVVFNGEIYNHLELRRWLRSRGHVFRSDTDGEVIPHLYEELGADFPTRLKGIFAIAVWDTRTESLLLVRDHFGVKPLYWASHPSGISFASEIRALLAAPAVSTDIAPDGVDAFLTFRFCPSPLTTLADISKLPPGALLTASNGGHDVTGYRRDEMPTNRSGTDSLTEQYADTFERAVVGQMMSDRPMGVMLSGGVDSAAITAVMANHSSLVKTYTVGFSEGGDTDETALAEETARLFATQHKSVVIPTTDYLKRLPDSFELLEEPVGTSSALAVNYIARIMQPEVAVALCGQGADELFAGYWRYVGVKLAQILHQAAPIARAVGGRLNLESRPRLRRGLGLLGLDDELDILMSTYMLLDPSQKRRLYRADFRETVDDAEPMRIVDRCRQPAAHLPVLDQMLYVDVRLWLPDELLLIADKMSMAASIELRVPFLDHEVVALAESIPATEKLRGLRRKAIHKRAMGRWLPRSILHRKERGWATPMNAWLKNELRPVLGDVLLSDGGLCRELFVEDELRRLIEDHAADRGDHTRELFALLSLGLWHERIVRQESHIEVGGLSA